MIKDLVKLTGFEDHLGDIELKPREANRSILFIDLAETGDPGSDPRPDPEICEETGEETELSSPSDMFSRSEPPTVITSQTNQFLVFDVWGSSWVTEFLHGGVPPLALIHFPHQDFSFTEKPSRIGSHCVCQSIGLLDECVWVTFSPVIPNSSGLLLAVKYVPWQLLNLIRFGLASTVSTVHTARRASPLRLWRMVSRSSSATRNLSRWLLNLTASPLVNNSISLIFEETKDFSQKEKKIQKIKRTEKVFFFWG